MYHNLKFNLICYGVFNSLVFVVLVSVITQLICLLFIVYFLFPVSLQLAACLKKFSAKFFATYSIMDSKIVVVLVILVLMGQKVDLCPSHRSIYLDRAQGQLNKFDFSEEDRRYIQEVTNEHRRSHSRIRRMSGSPSPAWVKKLWFYLCGLFV